MKTIKLFIIILVIFLIIGLYSIFHGYNLKNATVDLEPQGTFWLKENSMVEPNAKRATWGIEVKPEDVPGYWRFNVNLIANDTVYFKVFWDDPSNTMFEVFGRDINETIVINNKGKNYTKWTCYIENPHDYFITIEKLIVNYSALKRPFERSGDMYLYPGMMLTAISFFVLLGLQIKYQHEKLQ